MIRLCAVVIGLFSGIASLVAQDLGRTDQLWRGYLSETVRRGLPLLASDAMPVVPYWPGLERARADASVLEPSRDVELLGAWMDLQQDNRVTAAVVLQNAWPKPEVSRLSPRDWGEALFRAWAPGDDPQTWTQAWLAWDAKAYSALGLIRGLEVLEKADASAVEPLLSQALELHSDDRRFLPLVVRHPETVVSPEGLVSRDLVTGGWSDRSLRVLLDRDPSSKDLLVKAGYPASRLDSVLEHDYAAWLASDQKQPPGDGEWTWDANQDGRPENSLVFQSGKLVSWTRDSENGGLWTLAFASDRPDTVTETRKGASWTLRYEAYPFAKTLEYHWGFRTIVYRFRPLAQRVPLWPPERFTAPLNVLPSVLADLWLPLDPKALAMAAATVENWEAGLRVRTVFLFRGQVWLSVEDTNRDGRDDTWSYYRSGALVSVYRDTEGHGEVNLRELYDKGRLDQVQMKSSTKKGPEFVLFPVEGIQLWDFHGDLRPLDRIFLWPGEGDLEAMVFSGSTMPWNTMPTWEPRP